MMCVACGKDEIQQEDIEPGVPQMKTICELATMDCYYHNVAKYNEEDASGALWWKKDRQDNPRTTLYHRVQNGY